MSPLVDAWMRRNPAGCSRTSSGRCHQLGTREKLFGCGYAALGNMPTEIYLARRILHHEIEVIKGNFAWIFVVGVPAYRNVLERVTGVLFSYPTLRIASRDSGPDVPACSGEGRDDNHTSSK